MADNFQERLRKIRDAKQQESQSQSIERDDDARRRSEQTALSLHVREQVQGIIEEHVVEFLRELPRFVVSKGFYESKYSLSMSDDELRVDTKGEIDKYFSRITFLLAPMTAKNAFELTAKLTVRNRDIESNFVSEKMDESGVKESDFRSFISGEFLRFADAYFTDDGTSAIEVPETLEAENPAPEQKDGSDKPASNPSEAKSQ